MKKVLFLAVLMLMAGISASATTITVSAGNATITADTSSTGALATPWAINEQYSGPGAVTLQLQSATGGSAVGPGNATGTPNHDDGRWVSKTVTNNTTDTWTSFELELQSVLGVPSTDGDGLSFAQGGGLTFSSNVFLTITRLEITRDYLNFSNGSVLPGDSVNFLFAITDNGPNPTFWLVETPNKVDTPVPEPASIMLLGSGLAGLAGALRRKLQK
jgi:hypothetical protein